MSGEPRHRADVPATAPRWAGLVEVGPDSGLRVDGEPFPWHVDADIAVEPATRHSPPVVVLRLYADRIESSSPVSYST